MWSDESQKSNQERISSQKTKLYCAKIDQKAILITAVDFHKN